MLSTDLIQASLALSFEAILRDLMLSIIIEEPSRVFSSICIRLLSVTKVVNHIRQVLLDVLAQLRRVLFLMLIEPACCRLQVVHGHSPTALSNELVDAPFRVRPS